MKVERYSTVYVMRNKKYPLYEIEDICNMKELLELVALKFGDKPAFTFDRGNELVSVSYKQLKADVEALGAVLTSMGMRNSKVALIGENSYDWVITYFAVVNSGNIIVPLDRELPEADIKNLCGKAGTDIFVYSEAYADVKAYLSEGATAGMRFICKTEYPGLLEKGRTLTAEGENPVAAFQIDNNAPMAILFTSGTTGVAKGVVLSHFSITKDALGCYQLVDVKGRNMLVLPLHHAFGFEAAILTMLLSCSEICINTSLKNVITDLERFKPYNMFMVPLFVEKFYKRIWQAAKKKGKDNLLRKLVKVSDGLLSVGIDKRRLLFKSVLNALGGNLRLIICGGAPIDVRYIQGFRSLGINILNGYGITECSPVVTVTRNHHYCDGSAGLVLSYCDVKIVDPDEDGNGEILVKGDNIMLGYYKDEEATKATFDGEWFRTGDIGHLNKDGFLFITGRKKNLIVLSSGKNIYPEELEFELMNIPLIGEVVVREDAASKGSMAMLIAEIFPDHEAAEEQGVTDLQTHFDSAIAEFNKTVPPYKHIQRVILREAEFVKTTTKKIKRGVEK